jgi:hypothetical protein
MKKLLLALILFAFFVNSGLAGESVSVKDILGSWKHGLVTYHFKERTMYLSTPEGNHSVPFTVGKIDGSKIVLEFGGGKSQPLIVKENGKILTVVSFFGDRTDFRRVGD